MYVLELNYVDYPAIGTEHAVIKPLAATIDRMTVVSGRERNN